MGLGCLADPLASRLRSRLDIPRRRKIEEAKRRAEALLAEPGLFMCLTLPISERQRRKMELVAPHLKEFFERYSDVNAVSDGGNCLDRDLLTLKMDLFGLTF